MRPGPTGRGRDRPRTGVRIRSAGTASRPGGSTFVGSIRRSAQERIAGSSTSACSQPSSCSQRASTRSPSIARWRTPVRNGRSSNSASSGPTWPVSASTELRPVSTRSNGPVRVQRGRERLCGRERVGPGERGIGDVHAGDVDTALEPPRDRFAQRVVGGRWAERQHRDRRARRVRPRARTALRTARRQYGFISSSMPSRRSRPSGPSSISSNFGICFTSTAMRTARLPGRRTLTTVSGYRTHRHRGL